MSKPERQKGWGYFGPLKRPDKSVSTELSIGVTGPEYGWKETEIPLLVPTLTKKEIQYLLAGNPPTEAIYRKAEDHARMRMAQKLNPFAQTGEQSLSKNPDLLQAFYMMMQLLGRRK